MDYQETRDGAIRYTVWVIVKGYSNFCVLRLTRYAMGFRDSHCAGGQNAMGGMHMDENKICTQGYGRLVAMVATCGV